MVRFGEFFEALIDPLQFLNHFSTDLWPKFSGAGSGQALKLPYNPVKLARVFLGEGCYSQASLANIPGGRKDVALSLKPVQGPSYRGAAYAQALGKFNLYDATPRGKATPDNQFANLLETFLETIASTG